MSAPRSVLVPFEELLSEVCGHRVAEGEAVMFDRHHPKSACWWLTWGDTMNSEGIVFGPAYELATLPAGCVVWLARHPIEALTRRTPKSEALGMCLRRLMFHTSVPTIPTPTIAANAAQES